MFEIVAFAARVARFMVDPPIFVVTLVACAAIPHQVEFRRFALYLIGIMIVVGLVLFSLVAPMRERLGLAAGSPTSHVIYTVVAGVLLALFLRPAILRLSRLLHR